ncbi:MAG: 30S ribosomal protein S8 [bacterium]
MVDSTAQLLNSLKMANRAKKATVVFSYTKFRENILNVLQTEGYIKSVTKKGKKVPQIELDVELAYDENGDGKIQGVEQVSKNSRRLYSKAQELRPVKNGFGAMILTTPKGIMTERTARKEKVGGETLFKIW